MCARLRRQRPEVPLHVGVAEVVGGEPLLRADEVLELQRVADEEDRRVVADDVEVALRRVELEREAAWVAPGVGRAALAGDRREPQDQLGLRAGLEHGGLRVPADVVGHHERAEGAAALGVRLALGDAFPVEVRHLLDQVEVLEQDRSVRTDGQGVLLARNRDAGVRRRRGTFWHRDSFPAGDVRSRRRRTSRCAELRSLRFGQATVPTQERRVLGELGQLAKSFLPKDSSAAGRRALTLASVQLAVMRVGR